MQTFFRVVPDTNVIFSAYSGNENSPNKEFLDRWGQNEFQFLYSYDTFQEYFEKLEEKGVSDEIIKNFIRKVRESGESITIAFFHFPSTHYPKDPDDIAFILCADNGNATHLVTYDKALLDVDEYHSFKICEPLPFLFELRELLA